MKDLILEENILDMLLVVEMHLLICEIIEIVIILEKLIYFFNIIKLLFFEKYYFYKKLNFLIISK